MTTHCGQTPRSENVERTARELHFESCKEIKSCRGVKSPQNGEVLQKHSRPWLGGDDHSPCCKKGHWQISQISCSTGQSAALICMQQGRVTGDLLDLRGTQCSLIFFPDTQSISCFFFFNYFFFSELQGSI